MKKQVKSMMLSAVFSILMAAGSFAQSDRSTAPSVSPTTAVMAAGNFDAQAWYYSGGYVNNVTTADVNGDGKQDIVASNDFDENLIVVLLGNGDGTFQKRTGFSTGSSVSYLAVADLNGDGKQDVVTADDGSNQVNVHLNQGSSLYSTKTSYATGVWPNTLVLADLDGDGDKDIATANYTGGTLSILKNNGDGTFAAKSDHPVGSDPYIIKAGDLDGDGDIDLINTYEYSDVISVSKNNGNGTFAAFVDYTGGTTLRGLALANIDGDSDLDIIASDFDSNNLRIFTNNGSGAFTASAGPVFSSGQDGVLATDVDGDGDTDLVAEVGSKISVALNNGAGSFATPVNYLTLDTIVSEGGAADFNADGKIDLVFPMYDPSDITTRVMVFLNDKPVFPTISSHSPTKHQLDISASADITITFSRDMNSSTFTNSTILLSGSISGVHTATYSYNSGNKTVTINPTTDFKPGEVVTVLVSTGVVTTDNAALSKEYQFSYSVETSASTGLLTTKTDFTTGSTPNQVLTADLDGDGDADVVTANYEANTISVLLNNGSGALGTKTDYATGSRPSGFDAADIDLDGDLDLVVTNYWDDTYSIFKNNGNGTFAAQVSEAGGDSPYGIAIADINGDKYPDLMIASNDNTSSATVNFFQNDGDGTFTLASTTNGAANMYNIAAGDLNNDGFPDAMYTSLRGTGYNYPLNNSDGTYLSAYLDGFEYIESTGIVLADLNADGRLDAVKVESYYETAMVLLSSGSYFASSSVDYSVGNVPEGITAVDIDGDGDLDLVAVNSGDDNISVLKNNGNGTFAAKVDYAVGNNPKYVAFADMDGDGDADFVVTNYDDNTVSVYMNGAPPPVISSVSPSVNDIDVPASSSIGIVFDKSMSSGTLTASTILVTSQQKGKVAGSISYNAGTMTATFDPTSDFVAGDHVSVTVTTGVQSSDNVGMLKPYTFSFTTETTSGGQFGSSNTYALGTNPGHMVAADFDADGDLDLAAVNFGNNNISVLKNNGDGTYATRVNYNSGTGPVGLHTADLDNDGDPDLIASNNSTTTVSVLLNNGDATFASKVDYTTGNNPLILTSGDYNGDGFQDIAVTNYGANSLSVLMNNGNGTFAAKVDYATGTTPVGIATADVNIDGFADLLVANFNNSNASVYLNNQDGTFATRVNYTVGTNPQNLTLGDVDGDGDMDLVTANWTANTFSVLKNDGTGEFAAKTDFATGTNPYVARIADTDADGDMDVVISNFNSNSLSVYQNNGSGSYSGKTDYAVGTLPWGFIMGDVDGNGSIDMMTANNTTANLTVWYNTVRPTVSSVSPAPNALNVAASVSPAFTFDQAMSSGTFSTSTVRVSGSQSGYHTGSLSYDNGTFTTTYNPETDFMAGEEVTVTVKAGVQSSNNVGMEKPYTWTYIVDADSSGTFASAVSMEAASNPSAVTAADLNNDGYPDVVTANYIGSSLSVFLSKGDGTLNAKTDLGVGTNPWGVHAVDVDGDGDLDLISANSLNSTLSQFKNNGNGTFAAKTDITTGNSPWGVTSADIDGDGDMDLITGNYYEHTIGVLKNNGDGTYAAMVTYSSGQKPFNMVMTDVDKDGDLDVVASTWDSSTLTVLKNNGDGTFAAKAEYSAGGKPRGLSAADFNGDGHVDLVTACFFPESKISVLINNGDGTYASSVSYGSAAKPDGVATADIDGDGDMDILAACSDANAVYILKNAGDGTFGNGESKGTGGYPSDVVATDLDRDGSMDLVSSNYSGGSISIIMNNSGNNASSGTFTNVTYSAPTSLSGDLEVSGTLTVSAQINTGGNTIDLGSTGTLTGETPANYIVGTIQTSREITSSQSNIGGLGISIDPQSNNLGNTVIKRETGTSEHQDAIQQIWTITPQTQPSGPVTVTLTWPSTNDNGVNLADLVVFKSGDGGENWDIVTAEINTSTDPRTATFTITSFSIFTLGESSSLPVELASFSIDVNGPAVHLKWMTSTETNNSGWEVEMKTSGSVVEQSRNHTEESSWEKVGFVAGKGTTTDAQTYSYTVSGIKANRAEFRLKQIDTDGSFTYSPILSVDLKPSDYELAQNFPNPFNPVTMISYQVPVSGEVSLKVYDVTGRLVSTLVNQSVEAGFHSVSFNASGLSSGLYFYVLEAGSFRSVKKLTLLK